MASQLRRSSSLFLHQITYLITISLFLLSSPALPADEPYCRWGDCEDGLGEKIYPSTSGGKPWSYIANFRDGKRYKYAIRMREGSNWICEVPYTTRGNRSGLQFCATERGSIEFAYVDPKGKVKGSPYLRLFKGKITEAGKWFATDNVWPVPINLDDLYRDHKALRKTGSGLEEFLPQWFPEYKSKKTFVTEKEMLAAIEKQNTENRDQKSTETKSSNNNSGAETSVKQIRSTICEFGDCKNGVGRERRTSADGKTSHTFHTRFVEGEKMGYAMRAGEHESWVCEILFKQNKSGGFRFCATEQGAREYSYRTRYGRSRDTAYVLISPSGKSSFGRYIESKTLWDRPVDLAGLIEDHRALRAEAGALASELPAWFPTPNQMKRELTERRMAEAIKANLGEKTITDGVGCVFGDCENGFGTYVLANGDKFTGSWKGSKRNGHFVSWINSTQTECEGAIINDEPEGVKVCLNQKTKIASLGYGQGGLSNGPILLWRETSGSIWSLGAYIDGNLNLKDYDPSLVNAVVMERDWLKLQKRREPLIRESFLSKRFLALNLPSQDAVSEELRKKELARAEKTQKIPTEAPIRLGCVSGNCDSGFGEFATRNATYVGIFSSGRFGGYVLITSTEKQCEAQMKDGLHDGIEHCVSLETGNHSFSEKTGQKLDGIQVIYTDSGSLVDYAFYESGEKQSFSFTSERDKERLARIELEYLLEELTDLKRSQDARIDKYKVAALNKLPVVGAERVKSESVKQIARPKTSPPEKQTLKAPRRPDETGQRESLAEPRVAKKTVPKVSKAGSSQRSQSVKQTVTPDKPKSNLQRLAYIVAELNAGSRQINYNYRLDKVRIDPNKFELVYEFTAMVPIRELDTSVLSVANQTAYCSSQKLKPFRDENMPARWSYVDAEDQTFEVVTAVSDCS